MSYIFLDESGDLGFKPNKKNSKYFIIAFLFANDKKPIEKVIKNIHSALRKKVKRLSGGVLHSVKEKPSTRKKLLTSITLLQDVKIMIIYLNKSKVHTNLQNEQPVLYNYVTNILLDRIMNKNLVDRRQKISLIAAKRETNKFLNQNFKIYLQKQLENKHKLKIEILVQTPANEKALQAVDFVSWGIFRKYERDDNTYYNIIKSKIVEENGLFK